MKLLLLFRDCLQVRRYRIYTKYYRISSIVLVKAFLTLTVSWRFSLDPKNYHSNTCVQWGSWEFVSVTLRYNFWSYRLRGCMLLISPENILKRNGTIFKKLNEHFFKISKMAFINCYQKFYRNNLPELL